MSFSVSVPPAFWIAADRRHRRREPARGEEVRGLVEALLMLADQPVVDRILRDLVVVVRAADQALEILGLHGLEHVEDVASGREGDPELVQPIRHQLPERPALPGPDDEDVLGARLVLEGPDDLLDRSGEIGCVPGRVLLVDHLGPELLDGGLVGGDPVASKGVVLGDRGDQHPGLGDREGVRDRVLPRVPAGPEDVAVPVLAGDAVGHGRLDDQDLLELLGHREDREGRRARCRPHDEVDLVVPIELGHLLLRDVGLQLVVLDQDFDLPPEHGVGAARPVLQAELEAVDRLLRVNLERPGQALHEPDPDRCLGSSRAGGEHDRQEGEGGSEAEEEGPVSAHDDLPAGQFFGPAWRSGDSARVGRHRIVDAAPRQATAPSRGRAPNPRAR